MLKVGKSLIFGRGCFATTALPKRKKFAEYCGELVQGQRKIEARVLKQWKQGVVKIVWLAENLAIDGAVGGNETAYINHSCEPNAFARRTPGNKMLFFALRDIKAGEEITIDYQDPIHPSTEDCRCGAVACRSLQYRK
jgi:SET domain-containing protein